ncbi:MAG: hypothetical protein ACUVQV_04570 [Dissulfurimicrobium sp.]|uniref:hypothetical protein n=1 Tax=Dissulfurimicrobium sp. TaxID=2022436 RepID=UPI0040492DB9
MRAVTAVYEKKRRLGACFLRLFHWIYVFTIVILVISGYYIYEPWLSLHELGVSYPMAATR